ncbi:MAG: hypothetical protein Q4E61_03025 [Alphaproteobacteria bacterium]|nr:hypothetical protein [Alphaproteobacteria bacterium]
MNNIIRFYNQNRKKIWRIIIIIVAIIILLQILNQLAVRDNNTAVRNNNNTANNTTNQNVTYSSTISGVTGESVSKSRLENAQTILDKFYGACNTGDYEKAYDMLTNECKEMLYSSVDIFKTNYYDNIFGGKTQNYSFENWYDNIYYVTIKEDALATGKITSDRDAIHDYVTVVDEKLNISSYIGRTQINKEEKHENITMLVISKDTFMDYETYNIRIKNNSENTICLTTCGSSQDIYIQDSNNVKYGVYNHELLRKKMEIQPNATTALAFKFYSSYVSSKEIKRLCFKNLNLNYIDGEEELYEYRIDF